MAESRRPSPAGGVGRLLLGALLLLAVAPAGHRGLGGTPLAAQATGEAVLAGAQARSLAEAHRLHGTLGLLAGAGGPVPASPSTAGQRLQGSPRWVVDAGVGVVRGALPAARGPAGPVIAADAPLAGAGPSRLLLAPRLTAVAGVFEGFAPGATLAGVASVDLVGELRWLPVPSPGPLDGSALAWGAGARVGILRESFTFPGATLVVLHRRLGQVSLAPAEELVRGNLGTGTGGERTFEVVRQGSVQPSVTSLRAVLGKDLLEVGLSAGVQRDRIRGRARTTTLVIPDEGAVALVPADRTAALPVDRTTWFVGFNRTWVVAQIAAEVGWSPAPAAPDVAALGLPHGGAGAGSGFSGALSFRITY